MIIGSIEQTQCLAFLSEVPVLRRAFSWIRQLSAQAPDGVTELEGRDVYVNVHAYELRRREDCVWESHRQTADIQYCLEGGELIDWTPVAPALSAVSYDTEKDFEIWPGELAAAETIHLQPGRFVIFLPGELHRPMIVEGVEAHIRKLVVKIHERFLPQP